MFTGRGRFSADGQFNVADLIDVARNINRQVENSIIENNFQEKRIVSMDELSSAFYLRLQARDKPGVFASLATAFGGEQVSLDMIIQKRSVQGMAEIVLVTHKVEEKNFNSALRSIQRSPAINKINSVFRVIEK